MWETVSSVQPWHQAEGPMHMSHRPEDTVIQLHTWQLLLKCRFDSRFEDVQRFVRLLFGDH